MYTFYYAPGSCSVASHIALEMAGADYQAVRINLAANEQRDADYLNLNPKGRVPLLVTPEGSVTENPAILLYIALQFPAAELVPLDDPFQMARVSAFNAYLSSTVHVAHAHGVRGYRWADSVDAIEEMKRKMPEVMTDCFRMIEDSLFEGPWAIGDRFTISDIYLFTIATWLEADRVEPAQFPRVLAHRKRMAENAAVKRVLAAQ